MSREVVATYRFQFTPEFGFSDARNLVPYLERLGVSHLYASPILKPRTGSQHGYDVVDPTRLNPELGEEREFDELVQGLANRDMGLILDIVPNHMAASTDNYWWSDVLEHGHSSRFAGYFDIDWSRVESGHGHRILLPVIGDHLGRTLENGELRLMLDERGLAVHYYEHRFPLEPSTYDRVIAAVMDRLDADDHGLVDLERLLQSATSLPPAYAETQAERARHASLAPGISSQLWRVYHSRMSVRDAFDEVIEELNGNPGDPSSFSGLEQLLDRQPWRLAFWRRASEEINYRRFFDIADLVSLRVEDPEVFESVHSLVLELAGTDGIDGFRADHVDGLLDPKGYAERLQQRLAESSGRSEKPILLVEKILTGQERMPPDWQVSGTTGYEFAHRVNALLADAAGLERIERHYRDLTGIEHGFQQVVYATKAQVLDDLFAGEFQQLVSGLHRLARAERYGRDLSRRQLGNALRAVMIYLPVYRTYIRDQGPDERDRAIIQQTLEQAQSATDGVEDLVWQLLTEILLTSGDEPNAPDRIRWLRRWQQFTGPLMAKGLEDTALYAYTPLLSLNEVGGEPETIDVAQFHEYNQHVAANWSQTMLTTSTHDTKRSEDVRARLGVLSELSDEWLKHLSGWREANAELRDTIDGQPVPDANEEQFIYQTLLGAWPLNPAEFPTFRERVKEYLTKAMREAKIHTTWINVNDEHERAVLGFVDRILGQDPGGAFLRDFAAFQTRIASYGAWNSLAQLVLKLTSPGFPDIYQGNELWDLSLADPDNRRPIDFDLRDRYLDEFEAIDAGTLQAMLEQWRDGRIKLLVTSQILRDRRSDPEPFRSGEYQALRVSGCHAERVVAFTRHAGEQWSITVVPRHTTRLVMPENAPIGSDTWGDTWLELPDDAPTDWTDVIGGNTYSAGETREIRLADVLSQLPVAVLRATR